jgi:hypothetical protein
VALTSALRQRGGGGFNGPGTRSVARWFSRTGARETGRSEEGGLHRAAVTETEELAVVTHWRQRCSGIGRTRVQGIPHL